MIRKIDKGEGPPPSPFIVPGEINLTTNQGKKKVYVVIRLEITNLLPELTYQLLNTDFEPSLS